jgi:hypothetical protein
VLVLLCWKLRTSKCVWSSEPLGLSTIAWWRATTRAVRSTSQLRVDLSHSSIFPLRQNAPDETLAARLARSPSSIAFAFASAAVPLWHPPSRAPPRRLPLRHTAAGGKEEKMELWWAAGRREMRQRHVRPRTCLLPFPAPSPTVPRSPSLGALPPQIAPHGWRHWWKKVGLPLFLLSFSLRWFVSAVSFSVLILLLILDRFPGSPLVQRLKVDYLPLSRLQVAYRHEPVAHLHPIFEIFCSRFALSILFFWFVHARNNFCFL